MGHNGVEECRQRLSLYPGGGAQKAIWKVLNPFLFKNVLAQQFYLSKLVILSPPRYLIRSRVGSADDR